MHSLKQRIKDWMHERRIAQLHRQLLAVSPRIRPAVWAVLRDAILRRSQRQVARMERDRGLV